MHWFLEDIHSRVLCKKSFELNNWDIYSLCKYAWFLLFCCTVVAHRVQFSKMNNYRHKSECSDNPLRTCPNWQPHYKNSKGEWVYFYSAVRIGTKDGGLYIKLATNTFPYSAIAFIISVIAEKKNVAFNSKRKFLHANWILASFGIIFSGKPFKLQS